MKKRSILTKLAAILVLMVVLAGQCFAGTEAFSDISGVAGKEKIISLQERGFVNGTGNGLFAPEAPVTAAQGIQFLVKAFDLNIDNIRFIKEPKATDYFTKANDNAWYADSFIIAGLSGLEFPQDLDPNAKWTKEEFTYFLVKTMEKQGNLPMINLVPVTISDEAQINVSYSGAIQRALLYKVTELDAAGGFDPKGIITRSEAAVEVYNALEYLKAHPAPIIE